MDRNPSPIYMMILSIINIPRFSFHLIIQFVIVFYYYSECQKELYNEETEPRGETDIETADENTADDSTDTDTKVQTRHIPAEDARSRAVDIIDQTRLHCRTCTPLEEAPDEQVDIEQNRRARQQPHGKHT